MLKGKLNKLFKPKKESVKAGLSVPLVKKEYFDGASWYYYATENYVDNKPLSGFQTPIANINFGGFKITNHAEPTNAQDVATKNYVDTHAASGNVILTGDVTGTGALGSSVQTVLSRTITFTNGNTFLLNNTAGVTSAGTSWSLAGGATINEILLGFPNYSLNIAGVQTGPAEFSLKYYNGASYVPAYKHSVTDSKFYFYHNIDAQNKTINNVANPSSAQDVATKSYVDSVAGGGDTFQTLPSQSSVTWNFNSGNIANITLTSDTTITPNVGSASKGTLIVKQDATGNRKLYLPSGIYRTGSTSTNIPLSTVANLVDVLVFQKDGGNNLYLHTVTYGMIQIGSAPTNKYIFIYDGALKTIPIIASANNVCRIRMIGGGGGQGVYSSNQGNSGAGGFSVYHFSTTNYIGQELKIAVGGGGQGGNSNSVSYNAGTGGWPNGGNASYWSSGIGGEYGGGGGGRSDIRVGPTTQSFSTATMLAIAGGGGGGTGYSSNAGAGGGSSGQNSVSSASTGGSQTAGGTSAPTPPTGFIQAGFLQGAGFPSPTRNDTYMGGGGGDGYYGGGFSAGFVGGSGGSGYINVSFSGYLASYSSIPSATYQGNGIAIPSQASSDSDFNDGSGIGYVGIPNGGAVGSRGGNGKIIIEFL